MHRRDFLRSAGTVAGGTAAAGAAGAVSAQNSGGGGSSKPDYGGWFSDVSNFSSTVDKRGQKSVTVKVGVEGNGGNWAFGPPAIHVDTGTTVTWEWTGKGGSHNVVADDGSYKSGSPVAKAGNTFEQTFKKAGISKYYCNPHHSLGMKGAVVVGDDYPTTKPGASTPVKADQMGVPFRAHYVGIATFLGISSTLAFTFYLLKYGESSHTSGGNN